MRTITDGRVHRWHELSTRFGYLGLKNFRAPFDILPLRDQFGSVRSRYRVSPGERGSGEAGKTNHVEEMQFLVSTFDFTVGTDKQLGVESRFVVAGSLSWIVRVTTFGFKTAQIGC